MELILSFKHLPFIERGATYEIGSGKSHSLSFYFLGANYSLLVDNQVVFADVIKCVDDVEEVYLKESEYNISDSFYSYIFSDVNSRDLGEITDKDRIVSFYIDREKRAGIENIVFNVFNNGRKRPVAEYYMYRLKEKYDNGVITNGIVEIFKDRKDTIENDGGGFIEDKESEDGILENGFIDINKNDDVIDKIEDTFTRKVTDYGVSENIVVRANTEIKDLLYDKYQKMLSQTNNEIVVNQTMLVDMGDYKELLQNQYVTITTPDNRTHRFENKYLRNSDSLLDEPSSGSMLGGNDTDLLIDDYWKLYDESDNTLYIDELNKKLSQDIYSKPILSFDLTVFNKDNLKLYNEHNYLELHKDNFYLYYLDAFFSGSYRESSDIDLKDDYLFLLKDVQHLFINKENVQVIKTGGEVRKFNDSKFGILQDREAYLIENKVLNKFGSDISMEETEKFLFHPLDGVYFVNTDKWFNHEKTLYQEYSGFMTHGSDKKTYLNGYSEFVGEIDDDFKLYILDNFSISGKDKALDIINDFSIAGDDDVVYVSDTFKTSTKFDNSLITNGETWIIGNYGSELEFLSDVMIGKYNKDIVLDYGQLLIEKYYHKVVYGFENIFFRVTQRYTDRREDNIWSYVKIREMYNDTSVIMMNRDGGHLYTNENISVSDIFRNIFKYDTDTFAYVSNKYINISPTDIIVDTISKSIEEENYFMQLYKEEKWLVSSFEVVQLNRDSYKFNVNTDFVWINKELDGLEMNDSYSVEANKESRRLVVDSYFFANSPSANNRGLDVAYDYTMAGEYPKEVVYNINETWINRTAQDMSKEDTSYNAYRTNNNIESINTILGVFKESGRVDEDIRSIHAFKEYKDIFTDSIEEFLYRDFIKEIDFNEDILMGISYKEINNAHDYIVNFEKTDKGIFKNDADIHVTNEHRRMFKLNENNMFDIADREVFSNDIIIQFSKRYTRLFEDKYVIADKINPNISLLKDSFKWLNRDAYDIMSYDNFRWVRNEFRDTYMDDVAGITVDLSDMGILFYDTEVFTNKDMYNIYIGKDNVFTSVNSKSIYEDYNILNISKIDYKINNNESLVEASRISREINSLSEPLTVDKMKLGIGSIDTYLLVGKSINEIIKPSSHTFVNKVYGTIRNDENGLFTSNISKGTIINSSWELASRSSIKIDISEDIDFISKQKLKVSGEYSELEVSKKAKDMYIDAFYSFVQRESLNEIRFNKDLWIAHGNKSLYDSNDYIINFEKASKDMLKNDIGIHFDNQYRPVFELNYGNMFDILEREIFRNNTIMQLSKGYIKSFSDKHIVIDKINPNLSLSENELKRFNRETYGIIDYNNFVWAHNTPIGTYINNITNMWMGLDGKGSSYYDTELFANKTMYDISVDKYIEFVGIESKNIYKNYNDLSVSKLDYNISLNLEYLEVSKYSRGIYKDKDSIRVSKFSREINSLLVPITVDKVKAKIESVDTYLFVGKLLNKIIKLDKHVFISKKPVDTSYNENGLFVSNISKVIEINNSWKLGSRTAVDIDIDNSINLISKQKSNINMEYSGIGIKNNAKDMYIEEFSDFVHREFANEIRPNNDLWIKYEYKSIDNSIDYIINLEKLKAMVHENDTITRVDNSHKQIFEDKRYSNVNIYERELLENEISIELSKRYNNIFDSNVIMVDKYKNKISITGNEPLRFTKKLYSISANNSFEWISKSQIKTYISDYISAQKDTGSRKASYLEDMLRFKKHAYGVHANDNEIFVRNDYKNTFVNKETLSIFKDINYINIDSGHILASGQSRKAYADNSITRVLQSSKGIIANTTLVGAAKEQRKLWSEDKYLFIKGKYRDIGSLDQSIFINKISKSVGSTHDELFVDKFSKNIFTNISWEFASKSNRKISIYKDVDFVYKSNVNIGENNGINFVSKTDINISKIEDINFASKLNASIFTDKSYEFVYKTNAGTGMSNEHYFTSKLSTRINQNSSNEFVYKIKSGTNLDEIINFVDKSSKKLNIEYGGIKINKNQKETDINSYGEFLNRDFDWNGAGRLGAFITNDLFTALGHKEIDLLYKPITLDKGSNGIISELQNIMVGKNSHKQSSVYSGLFIGKATHNLNYILSNVEISKYVKNSGILNDYIGVSKKYKDSSMVYNLEWVGKGRKNVMLSYNYDWISKDRKDSGITYEFLGADKYNKDTFLTYEYYYADKNRKPSGIIDNNIFISKNRKAGDFSDFIYIDKTYEEAYTIGNLFIDVNYKNANFSLKSDISISNKNNYVDFLGLLSLSHSRKYMSEVHNLSFTKYRSHGQILEQEFLYKPLFNSFIEEEITYQNSITDIYVDSNMNVDKYISNSYIFDNEWANQERKKSNLTSTVKTVEQEIKEFQVEYQNLFVYHVAMDNYPKPNLGRTGVIDELILPHKDYKYSDYLKNLILPDGSINMRYVKSFDADTGEYTVTLPIEHPLDVYTDVGRDYLDVDVSILYMTIYMLKEIWKQKMFRYVAMTAQDSLKDMLMDLDRKIKSEYENNPAGMKEATRCLQLFRWYSEMAILNNCEYILKFYGKEIEVDFVEKDLKEIENLIELNNMHISDNFVLEPIDASKPASVLFNNNQKNLGAPLNISFKLYNVNRNSSISIDDENVEDVNYKQGIHDVSIDIKKKAVISFEPNGEYQSMVIANLKATNYSTSDFSVKYKGIFGETNKVMKDLLDRALVVGEVSEDLRKRLGNVAPVTIALDKLLTYFELHHENKEKGRRLITKK